MSELERDVVADKATVDIARAAAARWRERGGVRKARAKAIADHRYLDADSPERIAARINRLTAGVQRAADTSDTRVPAAMVAVANAAALTPHDLSNSTTADQRKIVEESLVGVQNYLSVDFLARGASAARTVGRVVQRTGGGPRAIGTGFLVAPGVILTNCHVLPDIDVARGSGIQMDFVVSQTGPQRTPQLYAFEPDRLFLNDVALDYALVAVAPVSDSDKPIGDYGWNPLDGATGKITTLPDDFLNIVQHPLGRPMEVVIRDNRVLDLRTNADDTAATAMTPFVHYEADTDHGSSGAPVFNDQWEVVALHHMGVPATNAKGQMLDRDGKVWLQESQPVECIKWIANEGIRVSSLVAALLTLDPAGEAKALLGLVLARVTPGNATALATTAPAPPVAGPAVATPATGDIVIDIPLRVSISLGGHVTATIAAAALSPAPPPPPPAT